ncbi:plasmid replication initiator TrfA [Robbsia sp. KACC 23696]|uniref:plasmid replication initiator TrfA n=1 Tax=Robbsia sp. KACC 23696 TaxID=3149231 RepID=UPI00325BFDED
MATRNLANLISPEFFSQPSADSTERKESMLEVVERLQRTAAARKQAPAQSGSLARRVQIPLWSEEHRPVLHDLVRSALFTCGQKEARRNLKGQPVYALEHLRITYTGEELRQRDYDVYLQILHLARGSTVDNRQEWVEFDGRQMIKALGWTQNSRSLTELRATIRRLVACALEVTRAPSRNSVEVVYGGALLLKYAGVKESNVEDVTLWKVQINSDVAAQLRPGDYTRIDWTMRAKLSPLEKWLHAFYATNQAPYPMKVETIYKLCGSRMAELKSFRKALKAALASLVDVGFLTEWHLDETDKIKVVRSQMVTGDGAQPVMSVAAAPSIG